MTPDIIPEASFSPGPSRVRTIQQGTRNLSSCLRKATLFVVLTPTADPLRSSEPRNLSKGTPVQTHIAPSSGRALKHRPHPRHSMQARISRWAGSEIVSAYGTPHMGHTAHGAHHTANITGCT